LKQADSAELLKFTYSNSPQELHSCTGYRVQSE